MSEFTDKQIQDFAKLPIEAAKKCLREMTDDQVEELSIDEDSKLWDAMGFDDGEETTVARLMGIAEKVPYGFFMDTSLDALNDWLGAHDDIRVTDKVRLYMMVSEEEEKRWNEFIGTPEDPDENLEEAEETDGTAGSLWEEDDEDWDVTGRAAQIAFEQGQK